MSRVFNRAQGPFPATNKKDACVSRGQSYMAQSSNSSQTLFLDADGPIRFVFVLLENFSLISFSAALETLRLANRVAGKTLYSWSLVGEDGKFATCSAGSVFQLDSDLPAAQRDDILVLCGGLDIRASSTKPVISWLRREVRKNIPVIGLCTATHTMAAAGLLNGKMATLHWENIDSFTEEFPDVDLKKSVYVVEPTSLAVKSA